MGSTKISLGKEWSTHMAVLINVVQATAGPVAELGVGYYSTPLLHWLCAEEKRPLWSYENNEEFYKYGRKFQSRNHHIRLVKNWNDVDYKKKWDVVLVDHGDENPDARHISAVKLKDTVRYIILHDSDHPEHYKYDETYKHFKYIYIWNFAKPWTTVVSNFSDPKYIC